jgi:hypothetical protein
MDGWLDARLRGLLLLRSRWQARHVSRGFERQRERLRFVVDALEQSIRQRMGEMWCDRMHLFLESPDAGLEARGGVEGSKHLLLQGLRKFILPPRIADFVDQCARGCPQRFLFAGAEGGGVVPDGLDRPTPPAVGLMFGTLRTHFHHFTGTGKESGAVVGSQRGTQRGHRQPGVTLPAAEQAATGKQMEHEAHTREEASVTGNCNDACKAATLQHAPVQVPILVGHECHVSIQILHIALKRRGKRQTAQSKRG